MKIINTSLEMKNLSLTYQKSGKTVGLVPTMGALHEGHLSLLKKAKESCDVVVMSIFVNPTQFGPQEDFQKYPRSFEDDCIKAKNAGCDIIFAPSSKDMYPDYYQTYVNVENITEVLCGASRPGHFQGVATVVLKLFNIVNPQIAVFGQKDAQQVIVIKRMVHDLNLSVHLEVAPIFRENDGLAMSSRNKYLSETERPAMKVIYKGLCCALEAYNKGERNAEELKIHVQNELKTCDLLKVEYIEIRDTVELKQEKHLTSAAALIAVACRTIESKTRLIDNIVVGGTL